MIELYSARPCSSRKCNLFLHTAKINCTGEQTAKKDGGDGECVPTKQREQGGKKLANMYRIECTELYKINKKKKFR